MINLLRHGSLPREDDGAIELWSLKSIFGTNVSSHYVGLMKCGRARWQATRKDFNIVLVHQDKKFFISELFKVIQDAIPLILHFRTMLIPDNFFEYIFHNGCVISLQSITNSGLMTGQNLSRRQKVFFTSVDRDPNNMDLEAPRLPWHKQKVETTPNTVYWVDIKLAKQVFFEVLSNENRTQS